MLTWNLFHGRADPPAGRPLLREFAAALAGWEWDVALLQEVPPWWPRTLAAACGADRRAVLTSRNALLPARRAIAARAPDLVRANGGGANAILSRSPIAAHAARRLCVWPERRSVHAVALDGGALWVANVHTSTRPPARTARDVARSAAALHSWAAGRVAVLGGDLNLREPCVPGFVPVASHHVDHVLVHGAGGAERPAEVLEHGSLSDHAPLRVRLAL